MMRKNNIKEGFKDSNVKINALYRLRKGLHKDVENAIN